MPVGVAASGTFIAPSERTGGAETHTLTTAQMPSHAHLVGKQSTGFLNPGAGTFSAAITSANTGIPSSSEGSGDAHNNLQPYITCYMWKRTN